jgi:type VI secretion system protein ImpA
VLRGLIEAFWPALHPEPEPGEGMEATLAPLAALNGVGGAGSLIQPLRLTALTDGQDGTRFALWQMEQAVALASLGDPAKREQRIRAGAPTTEAIEESAKATLPSFYRALLPSLDRCRAELAALDTVLQDKAGADAPGLSDIRAVLDLLRGSAAGLAKLVLPAEPEPAPAAPAAADILEEPGAAPPASAVARGPGFALPSGGTIANREDALRVLEAVAVWFRQTEPQSPIAYTLDELIRRARMPFIDLLAELLPDEQARRGLLTAAGINGARAEGG